MHLLEIDQPLQTSLIPFVGERHVLKKQRHKRNYWRLQLTYEHAIRPVVATGINKSLEFNENFAQLRGNLFPSLC